MKTKTKAETVGMTYDEVIAKLVALDVAKWGEDEFSSLESSNRQSCPTLGLALNRLAHYDIDHIDAALARQARRVMIASDKKIIQQGG